MGEIKRTVGDFEINLCLEGACGLCDLRVCEMDDASPNRKGNSVEICLLRDFKKPERVSIIGNSASRKVTLRDVVALLRAAAMLMEYVIQNRMPEDGIARRFHDTLYGIIRAAYTKPEEARVITDCMSRMLERHELDEDEE